MLPNPSLVSPVTRSAGSLRSTRRGRPDLLPLRVRLFHSTGLPSSSVPILAFSLPLVPSPSAFAELSSIVNHAFVDIPKLASATLSMDFITSEVQPLPSPLIESRVRIFVNDSSPFPDLHDWEWPPGWKDYLEELYQLSTATSSMIAVPTGRLRYCDADGKKRIVLVNSRDEVLPHISIFKHAGAFSDCPDVRRIVLEKRPKRHEVLIPIGGRNMPLACSG